MAQGLKYFSYYLKLIAITVNFGLLVCGEFSLDSYVSETPFRGVESNIIRLIPILLILTVLFGP